MGIDLSVSPDFWGTAQGERCHDHLAYTRLAFDRDRDLFGLIELQPATPLVQPLRWYDDEGIEERSTDAYGQPLTYLTPEDFGQVIALMLCQTPQVETSQVNMATLRYLSDLPTGTPIVLYWH